MRSPIELYSAPQRKPGRYRPRAPGPTARSAGQTRQYTDKEPVRGKGSLRGSPFRPAAAPSLRAVIADYDNGRYLASMLGVGTIWVRNVRASGGRAVLRHGVSPNSGEGSRAPMTQGTSASRANGPEEIVEKATAWPLLS